MITTKTITPTDLLNAISQSTQKEPVTCWPEVVDSDDPEFNGADEVEFVVVQSEDGFVAHGDNGDRFKITSEKIA